MSETGPSRMPPGSGQAEGGTTAASRPQDLTAEQEAMLLQGTERGASAPDQMPPDQAASGGGVMTWLSDKRVTALWAPAENRNSWVYITGVGWKKLINSSDTAIVALTILSASAKQTNTRYDYREESDGMIHEVYVW